MNRIRIAIGEGQSTMSRDILAQIAQLEGDFEPVGSVSQQTLEGDLENQQADVLICDVRPHELPDVCRRLFEQDNPPVVVGLARDGREAAVCVPNAGSGQLM
jgi:DNA-binding NarL/FixJ family response regulator